MRQGGGFAADLRRGCWGYDGRERSGVGGKGGLKRGVLLFCVVCVVCRVQAKGSSYRFRQRVSSCRESCRERAKEPWKVKTREQVQRGALGARVFRGVCLVSGQHGSGVGSSGDVGPKKKRPQKLTDQKVNLKTTEVNKALRFGNGTQTLGGKTRFLWGKNEKNDDCEWAAVFKTVTHRVRFRSHYLE